MKQSNLGTANDIGNFTLQADKVSPQCLAKSLSIPSSDSPEDVCDRVGNQWMMHQI